MIFLVLGVGFANAQLDKFIATKNGSLWLGDTSLYIGASFTRSSFEPVKVWLIGNEASWTGNLYFIDKTTNQEVFLFSNHDAPNNVITLSDKYDIPVGDTVYFMYKVITPVNGNFPSADARLPKYTGLNIPGQSPYVSIPTNQKYGHRWSVAGRVNDSLVRFGFEDNVDPGSDFDYDDIVFGTTLSLSLEEVKASLAFTDKAGKLLTPGAFWTPANDTVYLTYTDDYVKANMDINLNLKVVNRKGAAPGDEESFNLIPTSHNGSVGVWQAKIPIQELRGTIAGNKILETYFLGEVTASVQSHNRLGVLDGNTLSTKLNVAYPDKPESIRIKNCTDSTLDITRLTTCISVVLIDQNPSKLPLDTLYGDIRCDGSGDAIGRVALIEQPNGTFKSENIVKNEGAANLADGILSCKSTDNITVTYVDEIYGNRVTAKTTFDGTQVEDFYFAKVGDLQNKITSIKDGEAPTFMAVIKSATPNVGIVDQIVITLTSKQGESEAFVAIETGPNTGLFTVQIPFEFATTVPLVGDNKITGFLSPSQAVTNVVIKGSATIGIKAFSADITLLPALNPVKLAYIKDANGDGSGDHIYIVFSRPVEALPSRLDSVFWNGTASVINAQQPILSLLPGSPNVVVADYSNSQFPKGLTSVAVNQKPSLKLPGDNIFGGQKPAIADSMGPIIVKGEIHPFDSRALTTGAGGLGVDTLFIAVSEALKTQNDWQDLLRFSKPVGGQCNDYAHSAPIIPDGLVHENTDNTSYTILVASGKGASPLAGDCVYLNVGGSYTDMLSNAPPIHGEKLGGKLPPRQIELFRGYPPVVGILANSPDFVLVNNDSKTESGSEYSTNKGGVFITEWVPPVDFPPNFIQGSTYNGGVPVGGIAGVSTLPDGLKWVPMPPNISTIQIISTAEYIADISIFDNMGNFVRHLKQSFGYHGELNNQERAANHGLASFLVWDLRDYKGQVAAQGVYVWKVVFQFKNNKQEIRYTRTGVTRNLFTTNHP